MKKQQFEGFLFWFVQIILFGLLAYLAFHYRRLTDFPIGDDPAAHIQIIKDLSYTGLLQTSYPLPLLIFKFLQALSNLSYYELFVWLIPTFLFAATSMLYVFVWRATGDWRVAAVVAVVFVTARWVNDGLRMGLLAEVFSWSVLFAAFLALVLRKTMLMVLLSILLIFSHPFAFLVFGLVVTMYILQSLYTKNEAERPFIRRIVISYAVLLILGFILSRDLLSRFLHFMPADPTDWGNRTLWQILAGDDIRRAVIPLLATVGLVASAKYWDRPFIKVSLFLLLIGVFFSLNHLLGIGFISFRFYVYLEMGIAIFAALALVEAAKLVNLQSWATGLLVFGLTGLLVWPSYQVNQEIGNWQATDPDAKAVMLPIDRAALDWIKTNTKESDTIIAPTRYTLWVTAYADRRNVNAIPELYDSGAYTRRLASDDDQPIEGDYVYYGRSQTEPRELAEHYHRVYDNGGVRIWRKQ